MWSVIIKAALLALFKGVALVWERWRVLKDQRKLGQLEVTVDQLKKTAETEHEMAKVDATPSSANDTVGRMRDGKF